ALVAAWRLLPSATPFPGLLPLCVRCAYMRWRADSGQQGRQVAFSHKSAEAPAHPKTCLQNSMSFLEPNMIQENLRLACWLAKNIRWLDPTALPDARFPPA